MITRGLWAFSALVCFSILLLAGCRDRPLMEPGQDQPLMVITRAGPLTYDEESVPTETDVEAVIATGLEHDLVTAFAADLGVSVQFVPMPTHKISAALRSHQGHLAAAWLGPLEDTSLVAGPPITDSLDFVIQNEQSLPVRRLDQLSGKTINVIAGSWQARTLHSLENELGIQVKENPAHDALSLMADVANQTIEFALVDKATLSIGLNYYPNIETALPLGSPYPIAWNFPINGSSELQEKASAFLTKIAENGELKRILDRYLGHLERLGRLDNALFIERIRTVLPRFKPDFMKAQEETGLDWRLLAALAYQESRWDPLATSRTNVRGIMMLTEETADALGVENRLNPSQSILAGARYFQKLREQIPLTMPEPDRTWLAMAAYNIGLRHLKAGRAFAQRNGLNPDSWYEMKKALPWFARSTGKGRGGEAIIMTENVRLLYGTLQRFESMNATQSWSMLGNMGKPDRKKAKLPPPGAGLRSKQRTAHPPKKTNPQ